MIFKCCDYLMHQIVFDQFDIKPCCEASMNKDSIRFIELSANFDGNNFDIQQYTDKRKDFIAQFKDNKIPKSCHGCPLIKEKEWNENDLSVNRIIMANIAKCSCNCIYCVYTHDNPELKKYYNTKKYYDIRPILLSLRKKNLIQDGFTLIIGGGECSEFKPGELEWLLYFTSSLNGYVQILSSGIKYSKAIEKILLAGKAELVISPDSGTKKTYEKIKRVKAYDRLWANLKKYSDAAALNQLSRMEIKYIIIPGINDNINEVKHFIKNCLKTQCRNIHIDIEHYWFKDNKLKEVPDNIKIILKYLQDQKEFIISYSAETEYWLKAK